MTPRSLCLLSIPLLAACGAGENPGRAGVTLRDSAGITIVENAGVHVADSTGWSVDTAGAVRIGEADGAAEYVIGRLTGLLRLHDGSILIADAAASEVRTFTGDGIFARTVGRGGSGPGEFRSLSHLQPLAGDSVAVMDHEGYRVNVFDPDLNYVRSQSPGLKETRAKPPLTSHSLDGVFADGTFLMADFLNVCGAARSNGFCQDSVAFFRTDGEGNTLARFGSFVYSREMSRSGRPNVSTREPFPQAFWTARGDHFYYADAREFQVRVYRADGTLERIARVTGERPAYDRDEVLVNPLKDMPPSDDPRMQAAREAFALLHAELEMPDTLPAFTDMLVDEEGNVWLRDYIPPGLHDGVLPRWWVLDPEGRLRWSVRTPRGLIRNTAPYFHLKPQITDLEILAWERDEFGVERVVLYPLRKAASGQME